MPIPSKNRTDQATTPTAASPEEKAAMKRALLHENSADLSGRLEKENAAFRVKASVSRRSVRK